MKPIIGIGVDSTREPENVRSRGKLELNWNYAQCVADAGGVPVLIPPMADMETLARILDGWVIPGGNDIDSSHWGEPLHPAAKLVEPARFDGERRLYAAAAPEMPTLGICYGCQFLNVMRGGTLIQHLPDEIGHDQHSGGTMQAYHIEKGSLLRQAVDTDCVEGKSYHHQAIRETGEGFRIVARDDEGVIEGIEATDRPWLVGVQWHPERTCEDSATRNLFAAFVAAAAEYATRRRQGA